MSPENRSNEEFVHGRHGNGEGWRVRKEAVASPLASCKPEAIERAVFDAWAVREGGQPTSDTSWWHIHRGGPTHSKWAADAAFDAALPVLAAVERERDHERRRAESAERRCWAIGHPTVTPASLIPCQLDRGHDGDHWSTSGCSGGEVSWRDAAVAENARLLARIAAVEARAAFESSALNESYRRGFNNAMAQIRAALAASPTPTGPEGEAPCTAPAPSEFEPWALRCEFPAGHYGPHRDGPHEWQTRPAGPGAELPEDWCDVCGDQGVCPECVGT